MGGGCWPSRKKVKCVASVGTSGTTLAASPKIVAALAKLKPKTLILDGEVAVFGEELVSRFEWLRHLNHGDLATPPLFMVFDLLQLGEKDYRPEPFKVRRKTLEKVVKGEKLILAARRLSPNGFAAWAEVLHRGWEGYVGKDPESKYTGGRSLKWLKVKQGDYRVEERGWDSRNKS